MDECIEKQVDISKRRKKYLSLRSYQLRYNYNAVMELLNVNIWIGININNDTNTTFGDAEFEAFKVVLNKIESHKILIFSTNMVTPIHCGVLV